MVGEVVASIGGQGQADDEGGRDHGWPMEVVANGRGGGRRGGRRVRRWLASQVVVGDRNMVGPGLVVKVAQTRTGR